MSEEVEYRCFIGGLSWNTSDRGLKEAFEKFGHLLEAKVNNNTYYYLVLTLEVSRCNEYFDVVFFFSFSGWFRLCLTSSLDGLVDLGL